MEDTVVIRFDYVQYRSGKMFDIGEGCLLIIDDIDIGWFSPHCEEPRHVSI